MLPSIFRIGHGMSTRRVLVIWVPLSGLAFERFVVWFCPLVFLHSWWVENTCFKVVNAEHVYEHRISWRCRAHARRDGLQCKEDAFYGFFFFFWQYCFGWLLLMLYESGYPFPLPASANPFLSTTNDASLPILLPTSGARRMLVVLMEEKSASYDVCGKERDVLPLT